MDLRVQIIKTAIKVTINKGNNKFIKNCFFLFLPLNEVLIQISNRIVEY